MTTNIFSELKKLKNSSEFSRNVITLMTGTTIAQAIPIALSPILSRIYTPNDIALLAVYMSIVSIISTIVTLKYDLAIMLPEKDEDSINIVVVSIIISFIISFIMFLIIAIFNQDITILISAKNKDISKWLYFAPLSVLFIGIYNSLNYWSNRKKQYKRLATSRVVQSTAMIGTQIGTGSAGMIPKGLLYGDILGRFFSVIQLGTLIWKDDKKYFNDVSKKGMVSQIKRYKDFPKYSIPSDIINVVTNQIPVFLMNRFFGGFILGNYSLMDRVLGAPISLIGRSILDVFKQRASNDYNQYGNCKEIFVKTFKTLVVLSIIPTLLIFFLSPYVFSIIFGENWKIAGDFAQIMSLLFFFRFTVSPLSYMFYIAEKQKYDMIWQICLFFTTILSFLTGIYLNNIKIALLSFSITYSVMYIFYLLLSYKYAKGNIKQTK